MFRKQRKSARLAGDVNRGRGDMQEKWKGGLSPSSKSFCMVTGRLAQGGCIRHAANPVMSAASYCEWYATFQSRPRNEEGAGLQNVVEEAPDGRRACQRSGSSRSV